MKGRRTVPVGRVILGEGMPKICVPVMGESLEALRSAARRAVQAQADLLELRLDSLCPMPTGHIALEACQIVREEAEGTPLLFTLRTSRDGGKGSADAQAYEQLLCDLMEKRLFDAVDCELSCGEERFARIVHAAHAAGVPVVGSSHEFGEIGDTHRAGEWLLRQQALGADICKAAVMAKTAAQALEAALAMVRAGEQLQIPMIGIVMGGQGMITRVCCECLGSCLTFGTAGESSAPGQMDALQLRHVIKALHDAR